MAAPTDHDHDHDLIVIGGGAAGLAAARTGAGLGARTLLVADGRIGGDCTFTGCVPSKTLIEHAARGASFGEAMAAVRDAVEAIAATETAGVLRGEGVEVLAGRAVFRPGGGIAAAGRALTARSYVLATGGRPAGIATGAPHLTTDNVFDLDEPPESLAVLGGGATGCELAQAFHRLGVEVTVVEAGERLLPGADPEASGVIGEVFAREGIGVRTGAVLAAATAVPGGVELQLTEGEPVRAERLLLAVGRTPDTSGLGLDAAGIDTDGKGHVVTDEHLATSADGVYAAGDVTGRSHLTHAAYAMGRVAARNALAGRSALAGRRKARYDDRATPRVVFTDPEVAQVGLTEAEAARAGLDARVAYLPMSELDRAVTAGRTDGFVRLVAGPRRLLGHRGGGRLLGATIVAARAGEMVHEAALAVRTGMFTGRLAQTVHAYPTWSVAVQQAAAQYFGGYGGRTAQPAHHGHPGQPAGERR